MRPCPFADIRGKLESLEDRIEDSPQRIERPDARRDYLKRNDCAVLPLGSTEQHACLSLSVDSILPERVAQEAAEPLCIPVFPVQAYGITPYFMALSGTVSLKLPTYLVVIRDILASLRRAGFRRPRRA